MPTHADDNKAVKAQTSAGSPQFRKRIGSTVYTVSVHFSQTSNETLEDKIHRLIESEAMGTA